MAKTTQQQGRRTMLKIRAIRVAMMTQTFCSKALRNKRLRKSRKCTHLSTNSRRNHRKSRRRKSKKDEKRVRQ